MESCNIEFSADIKVYPIVEHNENASLESKVNFLLRQFKDLSRTQNDLLQKYDSINSVIYSIKNEIEGKIEYINSNNINLFSNFIFSSYDKHIFAFILNFCALILQIILKNN
ncbi:MAG: hypothetical protein N2321_02740 [Melioribacteraceae bacterium]|nr:hypothetical protein [Melioribacteraceae bacterium]